METLWIRRQRHIWGAKHMSNIYDQYSREFDEIQNDLAKVYELLLSITDDLKEMNNAFEKFLKEMDNA